MATRPRIIPDLMDGEEGIDAVQTGAPEVIDAEKSKIEQMMNDIAGVTTGEVIYWLHRATEKNKTLHGNFLKRYSRETPYIDIFEEARDVYGGGDFVLIAQKDGSLFKKAAFTVEKPLTKEVPSKPVPVDPFAALAGSIEKALVMDKAAKMMVPATEAKGVDPSITLLTTILTGMMAQNTALLQGMMAQNTAQRKEPGGGTGDMIEAVKLGVSIAGGKLPIEEGDGGFMDILKGLAPYVPQIIAGLRGTPAAPPRPPVPHRPVPAAHPGMIAPTAGEPTPAALPPTPPTDPAEVARALVMSRIVEEIKFNLSLPPSPKLYDHIINYIDAYMPDIIRQAEVIEAETFASYVVTLDPAFAEKKQFFLDLHKHLLDSMEELEPGVDIPGQPPDSF